MRYVLVGTGNISNTYISALKNFPDSEIVGCISRSGKRPNSAPHLESKRRLADIDHSFDAVIITTPNGTHHDIAIEAAAMGKHVLTEKPIDISLEKIDAMIAACEKAGVVLGTAYQRRTNPDNKTIQRLLRANAFGRIYAADLACKFWRDQSYYDSADYRGGWAIDGGGPFIQQACHNIDTYLWFFGMPSGVTSLLGTFAHDIEVEDHGAALLKYDSGMIGTIIASTAAYPGLPARLEVHCEKGTFVTLDDRIVFWEIEGIENPAHSGPLNNGNNANSPVIADTERHEDILRDFESAILTGSQPLIDAYAARQTTELILRIYGKL